MASNGPYAKLSCESVTRDDGETEIVFSGVTKNAASDNDGSTQFSGVVLPDGTVKGNFKELDGAEVITSANTDGSGFRNIPEAGEHPRSLAETARDALSGPSQACRRQMMPWASHG